MGAILRQMEMAASGNLQTRWSKAWRRLPLHAAYGQGVAFSAISIMIADLVPESLLGRATAVCSTFAFLGQFVSPLVLGTIMASTSITTGYPRSCRCGRPDPDNTRFNPRADARVFGTCSLDRTFSG
ncbi:hypothetical protein CWR43_29875 [Rhizobium sullae]|uniref:Uncharacterized protein n=1 Tax=Rhizobium sullae TaxID=50338 RepID=A0A2N0D197_RHISU|nr:hypothetical protein CWR43_29875 [Rhizobium sullae]